LSVGCAVAQGTKKPQRANRMDLYLLLTGLLVAAIFRHNVFLGRLGLALAAAGGAWFLFGFLKGFVPAFRDSFIDGFIKGVANRWR